MKRFYILLLIGIFFVTGCFFTKEETINIKKSEIKQEIKDVYVDNNEVKIGLYNYVNNKYVLYKDSSFDIKPKTDINTFQIVFSNEDELKVNGNKYDFIKSQWDSINTPFTLGIILEYDTINDGHIKHVIYNPDNMLEYNSYIHVYLYDAIAHRNDKWYSHITKEEFNENSYITSFKLYAHNKIDEVIFPIKLSVFTYDSEDDFDTSGNYRGNSIYTIQINKK